MAGQDSGGCKLNRTHNLSSSAAASKALAVVGATASGKSAVALAIARRHGRCEIISVDSMQVYRHMDIGTDKPTAEIRAEVPHHLIDVVDPSQDYSLVKFQAAAQQARAQICGSAALALFVGGTGLYHRAVIDNLSIPRQYPHIKAELQQEPNTLVLHSRLAALDPIAAARMEPTNRRRIIRALEVTLGSGQCFSAYGPGLGEYPPSNVTQVGLRLERAELDRRIQKRYERQLDAGFLAEVKALLERPDPLSRTASQALGYKELIAHLNGAMSLDEAASLAITRTKRFARRQERWFRRDPRICWLDAKAAPEELAAHCVRLAEEQCNKEQRKHAC